MMMLKRFIVTSSASRTTTFSVHRPLTFTAVRPVLAPQTHMFHTGVVNNDPVKKKRKSTSITPRLVKKRQSTSIPTKFKSQQIQSSPTTKQSIYDNDQEEDNLDDLFDNDEEDSFQVEQHRSNNSVVSQAKSGRNAKEQKTREPQQKLQQNKQQQSEKTRERRNEDQKQKEEPALKIKFDERHIVTILYRYHITVAQQKQSAADAENASQYPLDLFVGKYLKENKGIGSVNRRTIMDAVYDMTRWMLLLNYLAKSQPFLNKHVWLIELKKDLYQQQVAHAKKLREQKEHQKVPGMELFQNKKIIEEIVDWRLKYHIYNLIKPDLQKMTASLTANQLSIAGSDVTIPDNILVSCPAELFDMFEHDLGREAAIKISLVNLSQAPVFIRVNPVKVESRDYFIKTIQAKLLDPAFNSETSKKEQDELVSKKKPLVSACKHSPWGVKFSKRYGFRDWEEYENGLFEVQDESSQLVADLVNPEPGQLVLDYCAGSGGKTLGFAHKLRGTGQIYLTDIRKNVLLEAKKRAKRAGIQNIQPLPMDHPHLARMKGKMNWIIVDAPCSGSGTLRRNPELKYRITAGWVSRLVKMQREIFHEAFQYLKKDPNSRIVYSTCSIFKKENEEQIEFFKRKYGLQEVVDKVQSLPQSGGFDGMFAVVLAPIR